MIEIFGLLVESSGIRGKFSVCIRIGQSFLSLTVSL